MPQEFLTAAVKAKITQSKERYFQDDERWLKHGGSRPKSALIKSVTKLLFVEALNCFYNPEVAVEYGFADTKSEKTKHLQVHQIFQTLAVDFENKTGKFSDYHYTLFFERVLQPLVDSFGATWIRAATLLSKRASPTKGFSEYLPKSVWDLGTRTAREFHRLEKGFSYFLDDGKKVPTGEQWDKLTTRYKYALFLVGQSDDPAENPGEVDDDVDEADEEQEGGDQGEFNVAYREGEDDEVAPVQFLPGKQHAWLVWLLYGRSGLFIYKSAPLYYLCKLDATALDEQKRGRAEARSKSKKGTADDSGGLHELLLEFKKMEENKLTQAMIQDEIMATTSEITALSAILNNPRLSDDVVAEHLAEIAACRAKLRTLQQQKKEQAQRLGGLTGINPKANGGTDSTSGSITPSTQSRTSTPSPFSIASESGMDDDAASEGLSELSNSRNVEPPPPPPKFVCSFSNWGTEVEQGWLGEEDP